MIGDGVVAGSIENRKEFEAQYGTTLWKTDPQKFAKLTKVEPMEHALARKQAKMWITGRRRSSGGERSDMDVLEFEYFSGVDADPRFDADSPNIDAERGRWKLNPLAYWTYDPVWKYIRKYHLPYNELYDRGYTSLGDVMTTSLPRRNASLTGDAVDEFERSGRFAGMGNRTECGLHAHRKRVKAAKQKALEAGEELSVPALRCDKCVELSDADFEEQILGGGGKGGRGELLVEFYSPYCGGCQEFAPTLNRIANHLSLRKPSTKVARFDITENEIPFVKGEELFRVEATPTLYRVRLAPSLDVELYEGGHDFDSIVHWVEHKT